MFLFVSAHVSHVDGIVHVAHLAGHFLQVPFVSKNPEEQLQLLSKRLIIAPVMQLEQTVGLAAVHVEQSLASHGKHWNPKLSFK